MLKQIIRNDAFIIAMLIVTLLIIMFKGKAG